MVDRPVKVLRDYVAPTFDGNMSNRLRLAMVVNNFEIKPTFIPIIQTSIQFGGHSNGDPHSYINNFLEIYDTLKIIRVKDNAIWLRLFPFSLWDKAKS